MLMNISETSYGATNLQEKQSKTKQQTLTKYD